MAWSRWLSHWNNPPRLRSLFTLNDNNCPHLWGIGTDNTLQFTWRTPEGGWSAWTPAWNNAPKLQSIYAINDQNGDLNCPHVWGIGTDNKLHFTWRPPGGGWSAWIPDWNNAPKLKSICAIIDRDGGTNCPHVWGIGTDNTVYLIWRTPSGGWSSWKPNWNDAPKLLSIFPINDEGPNGNSPHVWGIGADYTTYLTWRQPDGTWSSWIPAWNNAPKLHTIFALNDQGPSSNCPHVWGIGTDNTLYFTWRSPSGGWYAWMKAWNQAPPLRSLTGINDRRGGTNCPHLWGIAPDNTVYLIWRGPGGEWSQWTPKWKNAPQMRAIFPLNATDNAVAIWSNTPHVWGIDTNNVLSLIWRNTPDPGERIDYLVITDDHTWDAKGKKPNGSAGAMAKAFQPLVDWRQLRGYKSALVTVSDIVRDGRFGYRGGLAARDLQEVVRNFLKTVARPLGIKWLLIGGGTDIVPVRHAYNAQFWGHPIEVSSHPLQFGTEDNRGFWDGNTLRVYSTDKGNRLGCFAIAELELLIKYDPSGAADTGWHYCTDSTYSSTSQTPTSYLSVKGPAAMTSHQIVWDYDWADGIPTDLYYSSLYNPPRGKQLYDVPYRHDWDLVDTGLYVLADRFRQWGGFHKHADISVGRAPVRNEAEAMTFFSKVLAY